MDDTRTGWTIHQVAERTGVSVHTLRAWERRYGVPAPDRMEGNRYRLYNGQDIADVLWMKQQVAEGIPPARASLLLHQQRRTLPLGRDATAPPLTATQAALESALARSDDITAHEILDQASALFAPEQVALQIVEPTMQQVGERWLRGEMSVWQEHLASSVAREKLVALLQAQPRAAPSAPSLAVTCAPNEEHELGLLIFTLCARRQGWRTAYLGQDTPLSEIARVTRSFEPKFLGISVATVVGLTGLVPFLVEENRPATTLVFGGLLPNRLPQLREHLPGLFLAEDALTASRSLLSAKPPARLYSPSRRTWNAVSALQAQRFRAAAETIAEFTAGLTPGARRRWPPERFDEPTLYLIDTLVCALAFEVPELVDLQRNWLKNALPPREVATVLVVRHLKVFGRTLAKILGRDSAALYYPLLERLEDQASMV